MESAYPIRRRLSRILGMVASILTLCMAIPHLFLPMVFPWERLTEGMYPPIAWALFAMNFFFSILLMWGGAVTLILSARGIGGKGLRGLLDRGYGGLLVAWRRV